MDAYTRRHRYLLTARQDSATGRWGGQIRKKHGVVTTRRLLAIHTIAMRVLLIGTAPGHTRSNSGAASISFLAARSRLLRSHSIVTPASKTGNRNGRDRKNIGVVSS